MGEVRKVGTSVLGVRWKKYIFAGRNLFSFKVNRLSTSQCHVQSKMLSNGDRTEQETLLFGAVEDWMFAALILNDLGRLCSALLQDVLLGAGRSLFLDARGSLFLEALEALKQART